MPSFVKCLTITLATLSAVFLSTYQTTAGKTLFGIKLRPSTRQLVAEVEKRIGRSIKEEVVTWEKTRVGESMVLDDGRPLIRLNRDFVSEEVIVHELFHLKFKADGFYTIDVEGNLTQQQIEFIRWSKLLLYDCFEHRLFFPKMRRLGFNPTVGFYNDFLERRRTRNLEYLTGNGHYNRVLYYFKFAIELNDAKKLHEVVEWFKANGWNSELEVGDKLVQMVVNGDPLLPDQLITVFVKCLNELLSGKAKVSFDKSETRLLGRFEQKVAILRVDPLRAQGDRPSVLPSDRKSNPVPTWAY